MARLWEKLFTRNGQVDEVGLHVAGAIIRHRNPFEHLSLPRNEENLSAEFISKWVNPFKIGSLADCDQDTIRRFAKKSTEINEEMLKKLLGDFNWRSKIVGAYFAAIGGYKGLEDVIGNNLLKSELCYAGAGYCLALAAFSTSTSKGYLEKYLEYYLDRKDLWFDQAEALCALHFIDSDAALGFHEKWECFVADKPNWNLEKSMAYFEQNMAAIKEIRGAVNQDESNLL